MTQRKKILVVDDEIDVGDFFKENLDSEKYEIISALDGEETLNLVKKSSPDLVLLDIKMPKMDGIEVLRKIKIFKKDLPVIMITGYGMMKTAREAMLLKAYDYITKPFDLEFIKNLINEVFNEEIKVKN
ncbi:MAG: response regulator [Armatimonadetes bacterium]|nr:response regulator [Armatimonadota bacterium]